jgi:hypothetical protein
MLEIRTHIDIGASASLVWGILTDFGSYRRWNPFIRSILGQAQVGNSIQVTQDAVTVGAATFRSTLTHVREPRELRWLGRWTMPGIYSAERRFGIESLPGGGVRFHHDEQYRGIVIQFTQRRLRQVIEPAFSAMNLALKRRAERAEGQNTPATLDTRQYADQDRRA